ncbi:hypothetical protein [Roseivirga misakiensis]|uniref:Lipoprotein n=1 Tax=Roseivirga misakiensis TaxID=1563681 RepID=A0A1E5SL24_9BACT|nr:hypothetical protein [Roseivirga misakiensis]OEJ99820.1 hypothetical protein BFP71_09720 [Roseivirga misakiensis]
MQTKTLRYLLLSILLVLVLTSCDTDDSPDTNTLAGYIEASDSDPVNELIACALGGESNALASASHPVSILFLPEGNASEFKYFETTGIDVDNTDFSQYNQTTLNDEPLFGGFLRYFEQSATQNERWGIVTFVRNGAVHYSNPIRIKYSEKPTEFNNALLNIDQTDVLSPIFQWEEGRTPENVIYFHVVSDQNGDLISGTYTTERNWQFYDLSNVVLNINDVAPAPMLMSDSNYTYTMLGVSLDNWVNLVLNTSFDTF